MLERVKTPAAMVPLSKTVSIKSSDVPLPRMPQWPAARLTPFTVAISGNRSGARGERTAFGCFAMVRLVFGFRFRQQNFNIGVVAQTIDLFGDDLLGNFVAELSSDLCKLRRRC